MSIAAGVPVPADFGQARDAVDRHLGQVLAGRTLESAGWERPDPLTLYVPMRGFTTATSAFAYGFDPAADPAGADGAFAGAPAGDDYLLRLYFSHYPAWPPSARFVNPATRQFAAGDERWLPDDHRGERAACPRELPGASGQVICCSATLEFYLVNHQVADQHRWQPGSSFACDAERPFPVHAPARLHRTAGTVRPVPGDTPLEPAGPPAAWEARGRRLLLPAEPAGRGHARVRPGGPRAPGSRRAAVRHPGQRGRGRGRRPRAWWCREQEGHRARYHVPHAAIAAASAATIDRGWVTLASFTPIPSEDVEHSWYDDRHAVSVRAISLVLPFYGRDPGDWPGRIGVHEYQDGWWHLLTAGQAATRISFAATRRCRSST